MLGSTDTTVFFVPDDRFWPPNLKYRQRKVAFCLCVINNGNRTDWSLIRSLITWAINKIGRLRGIRFFNHLAFLHDIFLIIFQIRFTFRLAFRRSFSSYQCDENTTKVGGIIGSGNYWRAKCSDPLNAVCWTTNIADTGFRCTDFSRDEDWSMGENNFTYTFPSGILEWNVRCVIKWKRNTRQLSF